MRVQVLLSAMHQNDHSILKRANIQSDTIVINQADVYKKEVFQYNGSTIQFLSFDERGVGLSRNNALMRADADIAVIADDDIRYVDSYAQKIIAAFKENPNADMIVFNVPSNNPDRPSYLIKKFGRVRLHSCLRYGAYRMAFRVDSIRQKNIYFSLLFGGGAKYSSGEDSLFIYTAIKSGLKVYRSPEIIGSVDQQTSTWFEGYTDTFFQDKGALFRALSPRFYRVLILQYILRKREPFPDDIAPAHALKCMYAGAKKFDARTMTSEDKQ